MILALDTETTGLRWAHGHRIHRLAVLCNDGKSYWWHREEVHKVLPLLKQAKRIIGHNIKYDMHMLRREGVELPAAKVHDTMVMSSLLVEQDPSKSLLALSMSYANYDGALDVRLYEWLDSHKLPHNDFSVIPDRILRPYTMQQLLNVLCLDALWYPVCSTKYATVYDIERQLLPVLLEMAERGVRINRAEWERAIPVVDKKLGRLQHRMEKLAGKKEFNPGSSKQIAPILLERGMELPLTPAGNYSTSAKVITDFADLHLTSDPFIKALIDWRILRKLKGTYLIGLQKELDANDVIHTNFNQTRTVTGRLASSNPNLQNIPVYQESAALVQRAFVTRDGYDTVDADYRQIEFRVAACYSADAETMRIFREGLDMHAETSKALFGPKLTKTRRVVCKRINFGILYGAGLKRISELLNTDYNGARKFLREYYRKFPGIKIWRNELVHMLEDNGFVEDWYGRRYRIPIKLHHKCTNALAQGTTATIVKLAMVRLHHALSRKGLNLLLQIHDSIVMELPKGSRAALLPQVASIMEGVGDVHFELPLPIKLEQWKPNMSNIIEIPVEEYAYANQVIPS